MNDAESIAYNWLLNQGYTETNIKFQHGQSPDFICNGDKYYEVKRLYDSNRLFFTRKQLKELGSNTVILVVNVFERSVVDLFNLEELSDKEFLISFCTDADSKFVKRTITIREDQDEWLKQQEYINLSRFMQKKLDELMEGEKDG